MNIIPLIALRQGILIDGTDGEPLDLDHLFTKAEKDTHLYVLDYDGLDHNNPNLELYQRLSEHCSLWIDNGPRRIDDIMDTVIAGATTITIRPDLWLHYDLPAIKELTDNDIYIDQSRHYKEFNIRKYSFGDDVGIILFDEENDYGSFSPDITTHHKIYLYAVSKDKLIAWQQQGITGIIIDLHNMTR
ncbi:MAG: hypothetical protein JXA00_03975 [Candidatus Thermoplasmatota archaeon]|nr:hypothetical protein [Candidatus Thermoplasmatota archaeon]